MLKPVWWLLLLPATCPPTPQPQPIPFKGPWLSAAGSNDQRAARSSRGTNRASPSGMDLVSQNRAPVRQRNLVGEERVIAIDDVLMKATLDVPIGAHAIIVLLHADSAGRFGVETRFIDEVLGQSGFGTLEVDLLTPAEEGELSKSRHPEQFSPRMLRRVVAAVDWLESQPETRGLAVGLLASRTETVAALMTAERCNRVAAVVSLGGCPDYASDAVHELRTPILVLFGRDEQARAAELACEFFARHLRS